VKQRNKTLKFLPGSKPKKISQNHYTQVTKSVWLEETELHVECVRCFGGSQSVLIRRFYYNMCINKYNFTLAEGAHRKYTDDRYRLLLRNRWIQRGIVILMSINRWMEEGSFAEEVCSSRSSRCVLTSYLRWSSGLWRHVIWYVVTSVQGWPWLHCATTQMKAICVFTSVISSAVR
jgi:hypothetical protein